MPAVAQISVDFSTTSQIQNIAGTDLPTPVRSVSPRTLQQYLLYNRELQGEGENFGILSPRNLSYVGGFITAGDKINVKHNDLQLRENLEVGKEVRTEFIVSRNKENNDNYENDRDPNTRAITISPRTADRTNNFIRISTDPALRSIELVTLQGTTESSLRVFNRSGNVSINLKTNRFTLNAPTIEITGSTTHTGTVLITGKTTINDDVEILDDLNIGTTSFNKFNVTGASGNVAFTGNLTIATDKFKVTSSNGNTDIAGNVNIGTTSYNKFTVAGTTGNTAIQGTLTVASDVSFTKTLTVGGNSSFSGNISVAGTSSFTSGATFSSTVDIDGKLDVDNDVDIQNDLVVNETLTVKSTSQFDNNVSIDGATTMSKSLTFDGGNGTSANRRVTGIRTLVDINEFNGTTYDNDAITVGDVKKYGFKKGMIMMWSPITPDNYADNFEATGANEGLGKGNMLGWAVCNGKNNTPNLENRFIIGGRASDGKTNITGADTTTGGSKDSIVVTHTHTANAASGGSHTHTGNADSAGAHTHTYGTIDGFNDGNQYDIGDERDDANWINRNTGSAGAHTHSLSIDSGGSHSHSITVDSTGSSGTNANLPPYYSLIYIMKI